MSRTGKNRFDDAGWREVSSAAGEDSVMALATHECVELLEQGLALIPALSDEEYRSSDPTPTNRNGWSSPGSHLRHLLDFVDCLLMGIEARRVDYTSRKRRTDTETSREAGSRGLAKSIQGLAHIRSLDARLPLEVRPEPNQGWSRPSLAREIQFVSAHVVHHFALIRISLSKRGIEVPLEFGVAASTRAHLAVNRSGDRSRTRFT